MIDAHVHLWRLGKNGCAWPTSDLAPIYRDFTLDDLRATTRAAGIDRVILVQSQEADADTAWLLSLPDEPLIAGVIGWLDFSRADSPAAIAELAANPRLRGLRPMAQDLEDDWYDAPELEPAFAAMSAHGLVLDGLIRPRHLKSLHRLAERHADLKIVIDHGAKPDFRDLVSWGDRMSKLARLPNAACKLSGLLTELPIGAPANAIEPAFELLWDAFGAERLIWGSDWPVLTLAGNYTGWLDQCRQLVPSAHHRAVFDSNARHIYRIHE